MPAPRTHGHARTHFYDDDMTGANEKRAGSTVPLHWDDEKRQ